MGSRQGDILVSHSKPIIYFQETRQGTSSKGVDKGQAAKEWTRDKQRDKNVSRPDQDTEISLTPDKYPLQQI